MTRRPHGFRCSRATPQYTYAAWAQNDGDELSETADTVTVVTLPTTTPHAATGYTNPAQSSPIESYDGNGRQVNSLRSQYDRSEESSKEQYQLLTGLQVGPDPVITGILPEGWWVTTEATGFELNVLGTGFQSGSVIVFNDVEYDTTLDESGNLVALVDGSDEEAFVDVYIVNGSRSRSEVSSFEFTEIPVPTIVSLDPVETQANDEDVVVTITGTGFIEFTVVNWDGVELTPTINSRTELEVTAPGADAADTVDVFLDNTELKVSATETFEYTVDDLPTITTLTPATHLIGAETFSVTVAGTNFIDEVSVVNWDGVDLETTFVSATELTVTAPAKAGADTVDVIVSNGGAIVSTAASFEYTAA